MVKSAENATFFLCPPPHAEGYLLTVYSTFSKPGGGVRTAALGADLLRVFVGDSSQFIPRTVYDVLAGVNTTRPTVRLLESYLYAPRRTREVT